MFLEISCVSKGVPIGYGSPLTLTDKVGSIIKRNIFVVVGDFNIFVLNTDFSNLPNIFASAGKCTLQKYFQQFTLSIKCQIGYDVTN